MGNFAVIEGKNVLNTILAESKEVAEELTGKTCIEFTTEHAEPGGTYDKGIFTKRKPFTTWVLEEGNWVAPVPFPEQDPENLKSYAWDDETVSWVEVISPE